VLSRKSVLIGKTVSKTRFRSQFDAAIVAIHRAGERLRMRIGDVTLAVRTAAILTFYNCLISTRWRLARKRSHFSSS
jgi:di/tricarboxylate transporter